MKKDYLSLWKMMDTAVYIFVIKIVKRRDLDKSEITFNPKHKYALKLN